MIRPVADTAGAFMAWWVFGWAVAFVLGVLGLWVWTLIPLAVIMWALVSRVRHLRGQFKIKNERKP